MRANDSPLLGHSGRMGCHVGNERDCTSMVQDMRWYVTPANHSADGCVCEKMSDAGGPTLAQNPLNTSVQSPDASTEEGEASSGSHDQSDAQDIVDDLVKTTFAELLSPVCLLSFLL